MKEFVIVTDSSCDLTDAFAKENRLDVYPLTFRIMNVDYKNHLDNRDMPIKEFYQRLRKGEVSTTALVSTGDFVSGCQKHLEEGKDILAIMFSSGLSGTYNSMRIAAEQLRKSYPDRKIYVVDSLCASLGEGLLVYKAVQMRAEGKTIEEVYEWTETNKLHLCHWFTVEDLNTLKRGGRVSASSAFIGNMLQIKPVMHVDNEGHLVPMEKVLGRKTSIMALFNQMKYSYDPNIASEVFISHGDDKPTADFLASLIKKNLNADVQVINKVGPVIGSHSGPGTIALFFFGKERKFIKSAIF